MKPIFKRNSYAHDFVNHCIKMFLNKLSIQRDINFMVSKREIICVLPYLGQISLDLRIRLRQTIKKNLPYFILNVILRLSVDMLFRFKDSLEKKNVLRLSLYV